MRAHPLSDQGLDNLFPPSYRISPFLPLCEEAFHVLGDLMPNGDLPAFPAGKVWMGSQTS
jgi:hypothetical protein